MNFFSDDLRRDPFSAYDQVRSVSPVLPVPQFDLWMVFDYENVKRALTDYETFSSSPAKANRPNPPWLVLFDPPRHAKLRALIMRAFSPRVVAALEPRIHVLSHQLLDQAIERGAMDFVTDFAERLPLMVIAQLIGIPDADWQRFRHWSDVIVTSSSLAVTGGEKWAATGAEYGAVASEMRSFLQQWIADRQQSPTDDLLTALIQAEVDGERLSEGEIFGFLQLLLIGGTETTSALLSNAVLCFIDHPEQLARIRQAPGLLPQAIEEVLRYRSPLQWAIRITARDVGMNGHVIPANKLILVVMGSANRDPKQFAEPWRFDVARNPNPHLAFGHGIHFCLGAALSRLEARIGLASFLQRIESFRLANMEPWPPLAALHIHGPARLPLRFQAAPRINRASPL
jgi:cytochrome P450